jgi:ribosomal protein S14
MATSQALDGLRVTATNERRKHGKMKRSCSFSGRPRASVGS